MENRFHTLDYLISGTPTQRAAHLALTRSGILEHLSAYHPTLAGTIPLDIDIPGSDLDLLCEVYDFVPFAALIRRHYATFPDFYQNTKDLNGTPSQVSRFTFHHFPIEIVAQPLPISEQRAFRHMLAEDHLLQQGGDPARAAIRALKLAGMKTEPAFGKYFRLTGDPYEVLLQQVELGGYTNVTLSK